jgi:hypothetical protein
LTAVDADRRSALPPACRRRSARERRVGGSAPVRRVSLGGHNLTSCGYNLAGCGPHAQLFFLTALVFVPALCCSCGGSVPCGHALRDADRDKSDFRPFFPISDRPSTLPGHDFAVGVLDTVAEHKFPAEAWVFRRVGPVLLDRTVDLSARTGRDESAVGVKVRARSRRRPAESGGRGVGGARP